MAVPLAYGVHFLFPLYVLSLVVLFLEVVMGTDHLHDHLVTADLFTRGGIGKERFRATFFKLYVYSVLRRFQLDRAESCQLFRLADHHYRSTVHRIGFFHM